MVNRMVLEDLDLSVCNMFSLDRLFVRMISLSYKVNKYPEITLCSLC